MSLKTAAKSTYTQRCEAMMKRFGDRITRADIWNIGLRCGDEVEEIAPVTAQESIVIFRNIKEGEIRRRGYSRTLFQLNGDIDIRSAFAEYTALIKSQPSLRTIYVTDEVSRPLRVTAAPKACVFPIFDYSQMTEAQRGEAILNAIEAEGRREYDPREDSPLRLRCFLTEAGKLCALVSVCVSTGFSMKAYDVVSSIFKGMTIDELRSENKIPIEQVADSDTSVGFWKSKFPEPLPVQTLPGYIANASAGFKSCSVFLPISRELSDKIRAAYDEKSFGRRALFLMAWSEFQGRYNSADEVPFLVRCGGQNTDLCPIKVKRALTSRECAEDIEKQSKEFVANSGCDFEEMSRALGVDEWHRFLTLHSFSDSMRGGVAFENTFAALMLTYRVFSENMGITYTFDAQSFTKQAVQKIHEVLTALVGELLSPEQQRMDIRKSFRFSEMSEEQLKRSRVYEKALCLSQTGLFEGISVEELTRLADRAALQSLALDDVIIEERHAVFELSVIVNGNIEESKTGASGIVKSVSVRKKGDIIGTRALLENNISQFTYSAASPDTEILRIKRADLLSFAGTYPKVWAAVLESVQDDADKMKKLWTII